MNNPSKEKIKDILDFLKIRRAFLDTYISENGFQRIIKTCKSCGFPTLHPLLFLEICQLCNWQDDVQDDHDADKIYGAPNGESLTESRIEFGLELDEIGFNMNASFIQNPEILLNILKEYELNLQYPPLESINGKTINNFDALLIIGNRLIKEIFKN